jgi:predicted transcriptional regulator
MNSTMAEDAKAKSVRASISFTPELYQQLERIAHDKKVSVAWVVRDAVDQYVAQKWPLLQL